MVSNIETGGPGAFGGCCNFWLMAVFFEEPGMSETSSNCSKIRWRGSFVSTTTAPQLRLDIARAIQLSNPSHDAISRLACGSVLERAQKNSGGPSCLWTPKKSFVQTIAVPVIQSF